MSFSDIPIRSNGDNVSTDASWWNDIRTALLGVFGSGTINNTQQTLSDNATDQDVTGFVFDSSSYVDWEGVYTCIRNGVRQPGKIRVWYDSEWRIAYTNEQDVGLTFDVNTSTGQLTYSTTSTGQTAKLQLRATTVFAVEA